MGRVIVGRVIVGRVNGYPPTIPGLHTPSFGNTLIVQQRRNKVLLCLALSWYLDSLSAVESNQTLLRE